MSCKPSPSPGPCDCFTHGYDSSRWAASDCWIHSSPRRTGRRASNRFSPRTRRTSWKEAEWIDTLAAAYAEGRDFAAAVKWQTKAIELATDEKDKDDYRSRLKLYKDQKPYRSDGPK